MHELLGTPEEIPAIVLRTLVVYAFILGAFRLSGKREVGQLAPFDFALILLIANSVQNAMVGAAIPSSAASSPRWSSSRPTTSSAAWRSGTGRWSGCSGSGTHPREPRAPLPGVPAWRGDQPRGAPPGAARERLPDVGGLPAGGPRGGRNDLGHHGQDVARPVLAGSASPTGRDRAAVLPAAHHDGRSLRPSAFQTTVLEARPRARARTASRMRGR